MDDTKKIQSSTALILSEPTSKISKLKPTEKQTIAEKLEFSRKVVSKMLLCFPDYGKCAPEYIAAMVATFSYYPEAVQERLASVQHGLVASNSYIPSIAAARALGDALKAAGSLSRNNSVKVFVGTPAWDAWQKARLREWPCVDLVSDDGTRGQGWYFPTEFPSEC